MRPFVHDSSMTASFAPLRAARPVVPAGERLRAVVIGGGTGAPVSIRTLLSMGFETSARGGHGRRRMARRASCARRRTSRRPATWRKCIAAMAADPADPLTKAFKYRFPFARNHTLGNLMLSALEDAAGVVPRGPWPFASGC